MKRIRNFILASLLALTFIAAPLASTALANAPAAPALELVMTATPLAAAATQVEPAVEAELPPVSWNPADWFQSALALGAAVAAIVALLKANILKDLHGLATVATSFGLGIGISLLGTIDWPYVGRFNELTGMAAIMFGVNAAVFASGGWDLIRSLILAAFGGKSHGVPEAST